MNLYFKSEKIYGIWCEICWAGQGQSQGKNSREVLVVQNFQEALELLVGPVERKGHDSQG